MRLQLLIVLALGLFNSISSVYAEDGYVDHGATLSQSNGVFMTGNTQLTVTYEGEGVAKLQIKTEGCTLIISGGTMGAQAASFRDQANREIMIAFYEKHYIFMYPLEGFYTFAKASCTDVPLMLGRYKRTSKHESVRQHTSSVSQCKKEVIQKISPNKYEVSRKWLKSKLDNMNQIYRMMRVVPYYKQGKQIGLMMFAISEQSFVKCLGFKSRDVLMSIEGKELDNMQSLLQLYEKFKLNDHVYLKLKREGEMIRLDYDIK